MPSSFSVQCPECNGSFPAHNELWRSGYKLLCPFCQSMFAQESSPLIILATGERVTRAPAD